MALAGGADAPVSERAIRAVAFDLMDTVVRDPFREAIVAGTGMAAEDVIAGRDPSLWPRFETGELDEAAYVASFGDIALDLDAFHRARRGGYAWIDGMRELLAELAGIVVRAAATNYPRWVDELIATRLDGCFDVVVASCDVGVRKPEPAFFAALLDRLDLPADAVLFVDDRQVNIDGARRSGLRTHLFRGTQALRTELTAAGVGLAGTTAAG